MCQYGVPNTKKIGQWCVPDKNSKGNVCRVATIFNYLAWGGIGLSHILDFWSDSEFSLHLTYNPQKEEVAAVSEGID